MPIHIPAISRRQMLKRSAALGGALLAAAGPKPVIVMAHHPIERVPLKKLNGLADSRPLWQILTNHRQVKAYVFGHSHRWSIEQAEGIHLINVPTNAYLFHKGEPRAWTQVALSETGMHITLHKVGDGEDLPAEKMAADLSWDASAPTRTRPGERHVAGSEDTGERPCVKRSRWFAG